jgi:alpha-D-xyloside xylohydrolase
MQLEFPDDPAVGYLDRQYMLGADLLVAPVFSADGVVEFYLPAGSWTNYFTGEVVEGPGWRTERHGFESLPLYVRDGAVIPVGGRDDRPDYDYRDGLVLRAFASSSPDERVNTVEVTTPTGEAVSYTVTRSGAGSDATIDAVSDATLPWSVAAALGAPVGAAGGSASIRG